MTITITIPALPRIPRLVLPLLIALAAAVLLALPASADMNSPLASKDSSSYSLEDLSLYLLRNAGKDGLLAFLQEMVVYQEGLKQGLKPTDKESSDFIDKVMTADVYKQFKLLYSDRAVRQLVDYTIVNDKYDQWLRDKIRKDNSITVTEKEANDYFVKNIKQFHLPEGVQLSIISVDNQTQAQKVLDRLKKGETFGDLAGELNMDPEMRASRGDLGVYRMGDGLPKQLEDAAFALKEGSYSSIIKGTNFHILYCAKRYPSVEPTFDEIKERLMKDMVEAKIDPLYVKSMDDLMGRELPRFNIQAELFKPDDGDMGKLKPGVQPADSGMDKGTSSTPKLTGGDRPADDTGKDKGKGTKPTKPAKPGGGIKPGDGG